MKDLIKRNLTGRMVLTLFILTNIIYVTMLVVTIPMVTSHSGGMKLPDMMPTGYSPEYMNTLMNTLGETGRNIYLFNQLPLDMVYPFLFGISYCLLLGYFLKKLGKLDSKLIYLCLLPLIAGIFDYAENIGVITILNTFPSHSDKLSALTSIFSVIKSVSTTVFFTILIIVIISLGVKYVTLKKKVA